MTSTLLPGSSDTIDRVPVGAQTYSKRPQNFDGITRYAARAYGPYVWDEDMNRYIDYVAGLGPVLLGHRFPQVEYAVLEQISRGVCYSLPTRLEGELADLLAEMVPCAEASRFAKNGADPTEAAVRLARAVTGRDHIFRCGYHGMHDWSIASRGLTPQLVWPFEFNDLTGLAEMMKRTRPAAVIIEAVPTAIVAWPNPGFLEGVRDLCTRYGSLLIFDETVTGFRIHAGGAQKYFGVTPDLATFSKGMGNGFPVAALCGRADLMKEFENGVFFSTTFGGDPVGLQAAVATLTIVRDGDVPAMLGKYGRDLRAQWEAIVSPLAELRGYDQRLVEVWPNPEQAKVFRKAVIAQGVLSQGYYNVMLAHNPSTLDQTAVAWQAGVAAVKEMLG